MLITYMLCLIAGGVLIALALDGEGDLSGDGSGGNLTILFNTPFWSFGLFGFGFSGLLLTFLAPAGSWLPSIPTTRVWLATCGIRGARVAASTRDHVRPLRYGG